jgi:hypothetical protein
MITKRLGSCLILLASLLLLPALARAQDQQNDTQELNTRAYVELMRSDLRANASNIVARVMNFSDVDAAKFWPIYREYELQRSKLGDERFKIIEDYAANYDNMTDQMADSLVKRVLDLEIQHTKLKREYYEKFKAALSPIVAARFFQVENQIELLIDLQIASDLPILAQQQGTP